MLRLRTSSLCVGLLGLLQTGGADGAASARAVRYDAPLGPFPSLATYCAAWRKQTESKLAGATPEDPPKVPYCNPASTEIDGVLLLRNPQAPLLSARIFDLYDWDAKERDWRVTSGLALQTAAGWYVFPHLWVGRWWDDTGCNAYEKWTVDAWDLRASSSGPLLQIAYRMDTGERLFDEKHPDSTGERKSRTRYQLRCSLGPQGRPLCTERRLAHRAWTE